MLRALAPYLAYAYLSLVGWTTRLRVNGLEHRDRLRRAGRHWIHAFWHQRQAFFTYTHRNAGLTVLVSRSRDGELIARAMELSRIEAARGSSSRGAAAALREMMDISRRAEIGITPDGPKGPARRVKPGVVFLAQKLGIPIIPTTNALSRGISLRTWDRYVVPLPFGKAVVTYGEPIEVGPEDDLEAKAEELRLALDRITAEAEAEACAPWS